MSAKKTIEKADVSHRGRSSGGSVGRRGGGEGSGGGSSGAAGGSSGSGAAAGGSGGTSKLFVCQHEGCNRVFNRKYNREIHMRTHTGDTPYRCDVPRCGRTFKWRSTLLNHQRYHYPEGRPSPPGTGSETNRGSISNLLSGSIHRCPVPNCERVFDREDEFHEHFKEHSTQQ